MGRKAGKYRKRDTNSTKKSSLGYNNSDDDNMMDDEIDAFHKQRDVVPLDTNEDAGDSEEDDEQPVFDFEDDKEDTDEDEDEDDDEIEDDDAQLTGLAAKIARQQKYLRDKIGGVEDEMHEDAGEEEEKKHVWGGRKNIYHGADNVDFELQSSDEELPAEEENEVLRLQKERAKSLTHEDFGLEDISQDESDEEPTFEEILVQGKPPSKVLYDKDSKDETGTAYEEVKKDLNALTREEQMDVVYSSAPELLGLLSELNEALDQLENKVNPLISKIREGKSAIKGRMHYMEVKQVLLMSYCQAITFYLLLKSEGQPIRDHPVISRLVEIKSLMDKMKELDGNLPSELGDILNEHINSETFGKLVEENSALDDCTQAHSSSIQLAVTKPCEESEMAEIKTSEDYQVKQTKQKHEDEQLGIQSKEMLKVRAALEEKLKQKGVFSSIIQKHDKHSKQLRPVNGQLETLDDFDDDAMDTEGPNRSQNASLSHSSKLSQLVNPQVKKSKVISGDDDLPRRDDIGERRRKHELRVLAGAGITSVDDVENKPGTEEDDGESNIDTDDEIGSDLEFYKQVERQHAAKVAAKAEMYSRPEKAPPLPETTVDGKRQITYQMEKNRGLTRARKKLTKNPRKKYKLKHEKAIQRRKGQVRDIRRPTGSYGGEASGINARISRSIRF